MPAYIKPRSELTSKKYQNMKNDGRLTARQLDLYVHCTVTNTGILPPRSLWKKWRIDEVPDPMRSGSSSPVSILARMLLEHLRKASSTHSPVLALASRNISPFSWANLNTRPSAHGKGNLGNIRGASKIKLKIVNKKRMATARRLIFNKSPN